MPVESSSCRLKSLFFPGSFPAEFCFICSIPLSKQVELPLIGKTLPSTVASSFRRQPSTVSTPLDLKKNRWLRPRPDLLLIIGYYRQLDCDKKVWSPDSVTFRSQMFVTKKRGAQTLTFRSQMFVTKKVWGPNPISELESLVAAWLLLVIWLCAFSIFEQIFYRNIE